MNGRAAMLDTLESGCVFLADNDPDRISYLKNIFDFIDYSVVLVSNPADLEKK